MNFIDTASVTFQAGKGGDGAVSFRREKYIAKGGPDGGNGGRGGNIILVGDLNLNTLQNFRHVKTYRAANGTNGSKKNCNGANGADLLIPVPVGTSVNLFGQKNFAEVIANGQQVILCQGGRGGFGNNHFKSSTRQTPLVAEIGEEGQSYECELELKLIADVGLVGLPNAGKSTFLSVVTSAKPKIADYPFTTLEPSLGIAEIDEHNIIICDIPGLIEDASLGKGLGFQFLRHVERCKVILHLIDSYAPDPLKSYKVIRKELDNYSKVLSAKPEIVAITKIEGQNPKHIEALRAKISKYNKSSQVYAISSQAKINLRTVLLALYKTAIDAKAPSTKFVEDAPLDLSDELPTLRLDTIPTAKDFTIEVKDDSFIIQGSKIEGFAKRTSTTNPFALERLWDIMHKTGVLKALRKAGFIEGTHQLIIAGKVIKSPSLHELDSIQQESITKHRRKNYRERI